MSEAYRKAGVDLQAGYETVRRLKKHVAKTARLGVSGALGGFGGLFDLSSLNLKNPVLVAGTDGVGTKILIAFLMDKHDTIGIDAVAMCVNDVVVQGAEPLFFLDYIACGKTDPAKIEKIVAGIAEGCQQAGCALIGGETAEMPGLYQPEEYDLAGFAVGACEKDQLIDNAEIKAGDVLIGLASNGLHSNGFSLVRRILFEKQGLQVHDYVPELGSTLGEELLKPTKIYVSSLLTAMRKFQIKGAAHITGGGFIENIPRMLPSSLGAVIAEDSFLVPPIFDLLQSLGQLSAAEMYNVFNMGIGMAVAVAERDASNVLEHFLASGEKAVILGEVTEEEGVRFA
ncbi:MAG TPA: phosphoribosylformylglycinamidine cyclo-ligase [Firmicutes bacterium]|nr:phosphoribosylformylglycinamidine cyclo-ligase [Bacillota bacterium]